VSAFSDRSAFRKTAFPFAILGRRGGGEEGRTERAEEEGRKEERKRRGRKKGRKEEREGRTGEAKEGSACPHMPTPFCFPFCFFLFPSFAF
jgi:hypothetical protein